MKQATLLIALVVTLSIALGFVLGAWSPLAVGGDVPMDPEARAYCVDYNTALGTMPGAQILTAATYHYSWERTGQSEQIAVGARHANCNNPTFRSDPVRVRWYFFIDNGEGTELTPHRENRVMDRLRTDALPDGIYDVDCSARGLNCVNAVLPAPPPFRIDGYAYRGPDGQLRGIHDGSALIVHLWVRTSFALGETLVEGEKLSGSWHHVAEDEARLRSAIPDVEWKAGAYKVGETAQVCWDVPVVTIEDQTAYFVTVLELNAHAPVKDASGLVVERRPITRLTGCLSIPVTEAYFAAEEPCTNALRAIVYSPILRVDDDETSVQPAVTLTGGEPPVLTDVAFDKGEYREGDTVHVTLTGTGRITKWYVRATIEGLEVLPGTFLAGGETADVVFVAAQSGTVELEARPYNGCVPGETKEFRTVVEPRIPSRCELFPDAANCTGGGPGAGAVLLLIAGLVLSLLGLALIAGGRGNIVAVLAGAGMAAAGLVLLAFGLWAVVADLLPAVGGILQGVSPRPG